MIIEIIVGVLVAVMIIKFRWQVAFVICALVALALALIMGAFLTSMLSIPFDLSGSQTVVVACIGGVFFTVALIVRTIKNPKENKHLKYLD